jgi:hypothetical protein
LKAYKTVKRSQTGWGVTEADTENGIFTIDEKLESMCQFFSKLDSLYGSRQNVSPTSVITPEYFSTNIPSIDLDFADYHDIAQPNDLFFTPPPSQELPYYLPLSEIENSLQDISVSASLEDYENRSKRVKLDTKITPVKQKTKQDFTSHFASYSEDRLKLERERIDTDIKFQERKLIIEEQKMLVERDRLLLEKENKIVETRALFVQNLAAQGKNKSEIQDMLDVAGL